MRVAIPIWGDKISPVFDTATRLLVVDIDGSEKNKRVIESMEGDDIARRCAKIKALEVGTLICSAISNPFSRRISASDIRVIQGISGSAEEVLSAFINGKLYEDAFLMPGSKGKPWKQRRCDSAEPRACRRGERGPRGRCGSVNKKYEK